MCSKLTITDCERIQETLDSLSEILIEERAKIDFDGLEPSEAEEMEHYRKMEAS